MMVFEQMCSLGVYLKRVVVIKLFWVQQWVTHVASVVASTTSACGLVALISAIELLWWRRITRRVTMTLIQSRDDRILLAVDAAEIDEAKTLSDSLSRATGNATVAIVDPSGQKLPLPAALAGLMQAVIDGVARGAQITIQAVPREVTTTTAATMLGISRPTLMKLVAEGKLAAHKVGTHTRVLTTDVSEFREVQREAQRRAFDELRELDSELELGP